MLLFTCYHWLVSAKPSETHNRNFHINSHRIRRPKNNRTTRPKNPNKHFCVFLWKHTQKQKHQLRLSLIWSLSSQSFHSRNALKFYLKCNQNCLKNAGNPRDMRRFQVSNRLLFASQQCSTFSCFDFRHALVRLSHSSIVFVRSRGLLLARMFL